MLTPVADGVFVHVSGFMQSNAVVVQGPDGVLIVDAGIHDDELACLATDIADAGQAVVAGFSTHPHWDHLLWHPSLGDAPRYGTALAASTARARLAGGVDAVAKAAGIPERVPLDLLGDIADLPADATRLPWDGPGIRILEHRAHAPGHAALLIEDRGVLIAGDMLSDVLIPMLDLNGTDDPIGDYLAALQLLEDEARDAVVVIPGHGSVGDSADLHARIERDRAFVLALRDGRDVADPRLDAPAPGWEWVADLHAGQRQRLG